MPTQTLAELSKRSQDELVKGVATDIFTTNPWWLRFPFLSFIGPGILVNRQATLGDSELLSVGDTITANSPSTTDQASFTVTTLLGEVQMNNLVQVQGESTAVDMTTDEIESKAISISRLAQTQIALGDGVKPNMNSLHTLTDSTQFTTASGGQALSFDLLDELTSLVKTNDGNVDFIVGHGTMHRRFKALYRAMNGSEPNTTVFTLPNGDTRTVTTFEDIPFFTNDYLSIEETANGVALTGGALTSVWAGNWDTGNKKTGLAMMYPLNSDAGISVEFAGLSQSKDEKIWRITTYWELFNGNRRSLARLTSLNQS
jgi:hypothetical protein